MDLFTQKQWRILLTRTVPDALPLLEILKAKGHIVLHEPMFDIEPQEGAKPKIMAAGLRSPQAILVTSANGARELARLSDLRHIPIFAVGEATASTLESLKFQTVKHSEGGSAELAQLVMKHANPKKGFLMHVSGSDIAGDLKGELEQAGFLYERIVIYRARERQQFLPSLQQAILGCELDVALFFSRRTLVIFEELLVKNKLDYLSQNIGLIVFSDAITPTLRWRKIRIAERPAQASMLRLIDEWN